MDPEIPSGLQIHVDQLSPRNPLIRAIRRMRRMRPCAKPNGCSQCGRHGYRLPSLLLGISAIRRFPEIMLQAAVSVVSLQERTRYS
jgi:hypothetical protein